MATEGISLENSPPHTPELNGMVERSMRTITEPARAILQMANLPLALWPYIIKLVVQVKNILPSSAIDGQIPYELLTGKTVKYDHLRIPGCDCYPLFKHDGLKKFDRKTDRHLFVCYGPDSTSYCLYNPKTRKVTLHRDIVWNEEGFLRSYYLPYFNHYDLHSAGATDKLFPETSGPASSAKPSAPPPPDNDDSPGASIKFPAPADIPPMEVALGNEDAASDISSDDDFPVVVAAEYAPVAAPPPAPAAAVAPAPAPAPAPIPQAIPSPNRAAGSARLRGDAPIIPATESWVQRSG
jgi:histone deacetylase 1/2